MVSTLASAKTKDWHQVRAWTIDILLPFWQKERPPLPFRQWRTCNSLWYFKNMFQIICHFLSSKREVWCSSPRTQASLGDLFLKNCRGSKAERLPRLGHKENTASAPLSLNHVPWKLPWGCLLERPGRDKRSLRSPHYSSPAVCLPSTGTRHVKQLGFTWFKPQALTATTAWDTKSQNSPAELQETHRTMS